MRLRPLPTPGGFKVSRSLAPIALVIALLSASPAVAGVAAHTYGGQTKDGSATTSRSVKGACTITQALTDLVLRCDGKGTAQANYVFTLPKTAGSVTKQVSFDGAHKGTTEATKRLSPTQFRVTVTLKGPGRAEIQSVTIEYYY
jgi:hypothetical protein